MSFVVTLEKIIIEPDDPAYSGDVFIAKADQPLLAKIGTMFGFVELPDVPEAFAERLLEIITDLKTEYYLPPFDLENGIEKRFEDCLQRANRRLHRTLQESVTKVNIERISVLIGLIHQDTMHVSHIGTVSAFLFHRRKRYDHAIIDIIGQIEDRQQPADPEKLFSNIISGTITDRDHVFCCNESVLEYISQTELSDIISSNSALAAAHHLDKLLSGASGQASFYGIVIQPPLQKAELTSPSRESISAPPRAEISDPGHSINRLLSTQSVTEQYLTPSLLPSWRIIINTGLHYLMIGIRLTGTGLAYVLRLASKWAQRLMKMLSYRLQRSRQPALPTADAATPAAPALVGTAHVTAQILDRGTILDRVSLSLNRAIIWYLRLPRVRQILLAAALLLLIVFSQSIVWQGSRFSIGADTDDERTIAQIESYLNTAEAQNVFNDEAGMRESLTAAETLLATLPDHRSTRSDRERLSAKIAELRQQTQKLTVITDPAVVKDIAAERAGAQLNALARVGTSLVTYDAATKDLVILAADGSVSTASLAGATSVNRIVSEGNDALILADNNTVYKLTGGTVTSVLASPSELKDIALYTGRLYTLQSGRGQIYRHTLVDGTYNSGATWIRDNTPVNEAATIGIDGGIFIAYANGSVRYLNSGRAVDTAFQSVEPPLSPTHVATAAGARYVYALDQSNKRVVVYEKNGNLKMQFSSPAWTDMTGFYPLESEKKVYVLSGGKIYQFEIPF